MSGNCWWCGKEIPEDEGIQEHWEQSPLCEYGFMFDRLPPGGIFAGFKPNSGRSKLELGL